MIHSRCDNKRASVSTLKTTILSEGQLKLQREFVSILNTKFNENRSHSVWNIKT
jgi:hypothetical protein